ncbi:hypothetical protein [Streptomyces sp. NPDC058683]
MSATNAVAYTPETFDADLIGAWDKPTRPYVFENQGGRYRFGLPQS